MLQFRYITQQMCVLSHRSVRYVRTARSPPEINFAAKGFVTNLKQLAQQTRAQKFLRRQNKTTKLMEEAMQLSLRTILLCIVLLTWLLVPPLIVAADPSGAAPAVTANPEPTTAAASSLSQANLNAALLQMLVSKGILSSSEANSLAGANSAVSTQQLLLLLQQKGLLSASDMASLQGGILERANDHLMADIGYTNNLVSVEGGQAAAQTKPKEAPPTGPTVIPAIAPVRVLPVDPPAKNSVEGITIGGVRMRPYGFIKATMVYDSYDPTGDDFPRPGFTAADSGPNNNPEFHVKARATRFGTRYEWPDSSGKLTLTGTIEADYEGNFSRVDNRSVSSIRSNALQLRLAFGRLDYAASDKTDIFFEAGQDWTIFGSSALMNLFETTFFGAYWGNLYERSPQFRVGLVRKLGGSRNWKLSPEFAIMMPSEGNLPGDAVASACTTTATPGIGTGFSTICTNTVTNGLGNQLGYAERQGADYAAPELESRVVLQFQLDKAPGVVPAQILWSGFYTHRQATILASAVPLCETCAGGVDTFKAAFPRGVDISTPGYGNQIAISLPTRWFTVVSSAYYGADLRFFFAGETLSFYNQPAGLTNTVEGFSVDRSAAGVFGINGSGSAVVARQLPVRGYGGFVQVGFPISRWFNADPKGRNAGWQAYFEYGLDAAVANDFRLAKGINAKTGGGPIKDSLKAMTVFYKLNNYIQFGLEESLYQGQALPNGKGVCTTKVAGLPNCYSKDWRTEFGPIFSF
jgi:hypothetical protein